jgi:Mrp family chromosome partitioning ATPase
MGDVLDLVDTLDQLDHQRITLDPVETPQREFAQLTQQSNAIGAKLQEIGQAQRAAMLRQISTIEGSVSTRPGNAAFGGAPIAMRLARDSARTRAASVEALLRDAREWHATMRARADSAERKRLTQVLGASPLAAAIAALVVAGALIFTLAVIAEARRPTVAHAREAERLAGVPVLGTAHPGHLPTEGRARLQLGTGIDPLRMVYLALTASGTRERTVCITGDDPDVIGAVAGRLAVSAAADARATVAVDIASGTPSVARYFGERHEPGFSEAIAAVRLWREVTRSVGASEGLGLDVVPAGARRADTVESVAMASNRSEFTLFTSEYDFTVLAAPTRESLAIVVQLCAKPATVYVARIAKTSLEALAADVRALQGLGIDLHGILLVDSSP